MVYPIGGDLDRAINLGRAEWERKNNKSISKKQFILKMVYENQNLRKLLESNGMKCDKNLLKYPPI